MEFWNQILLEELEIDVHLWLCWALCCVSECRFLLFSGDSLVCQILNDLLQNLLQNLLKHLPRIRDFIHDLAEHLKTQEHVEYDFRIVSQDFIFLDHLLVEPLV